MITETNYAKEETMRNFKKVISIILILTLATFSAIAAGNKESKADQGPYDDQMGIMGSQRHYLLQTAYRRIPGR